MTSLSAATKAKYSKSPVYQGFIARFPRAMLEIARVSVFGTTKHDVPLNDMSYMDLPNAGTVYNDAEARHLVGLAIDGNVNADPADGGMLHLAQKAWDALAALEIFLRDQERQAALDVKDQKTMASMSALRDGSFDVMAGPAPGTRSNVAILQTCPNCRAQVAKSCRRWDCPVQSN